jgi:hypothetical protein
MNWIIDPVSFWKITFPWARTPRVLVRRNRTARMKKSLGEAELEMSCFGLEFSPQSPRCIAFISGTHSNPISPTCISQAGLRDNKHN